MQQMRISEHLNDKWDSIKQGSECVYDMGMDGGVERDGGRIDIKMRYRTLQTEDVSLQCLNLVVKM